MGRLAGRRRVKAVRKKSLETLKSELLETKRRSFQIAQRRDWHSKHKEKQHILLAAKLRLL